MAGIQEAEQEFEARLTALERDANACAVYGYTRFAFHFIADSDFAVIDRLNRHPAFWNTVLAGLQASAIVALGRIFERRKDTYNAGKLIDYADKHLEVFRRDALAARAVRGGMSPHDAKAYAAKSYEPRPGGLDELRRQFEEKRDSYEDEETGAGVQRIRHNVYAHAGPPSLIEAEPKVQLRALEDLMVFPLRFHRALFKLYHDGLEPILDSAPFLTDDVIKNAPAPGVSTWEHLHAAGNVAAFLDWLRSTPLDAE